MSAHCLAGVAVLNALFLAAGVALLGLLREMRTWGEVARLGGLAFVTGFAAVASIWTLLLIAGVPFSLGVVVLVPIVVLAGAGTIARRRGRSMPQRGELPSGWSAVVGAVGIASAGVLLEGMFRASRLSGLYAWDAWAFWIPKAKAIYFFGGLDVQVFKTASGPSYPPLVPTLDAALFHAMGRPDVTTLHVQYWLFAVAFTWALAGILAERVPGWLLWPFVLVILVAPRIGRRFSIPEADLLLDLLFVLASVLIALFIVERTRWRLAIATILMSAMVLTKREGLLLLALLVAAALLASPRDWRFVWPRMAVSAAVALAVAAPWRIWYVAHGIGGEGPSESAVNPTENAARLWPSFRLAFDVLFSSDYWSVIVPVAIGALVLAALARSYTLAVFFGSLTALVVLGGGWITWAIPELPITQEPSGNPIVRYMGAAALLCAAASPVLLASTWSAVTSSEKGDST